MSTWFALGAVAGSLFASLYFWLLRRYSHRHVWSRWQIGKTRVVARDGRPLPLHEQVTTDSHQVRFCRTCGLEKWRKR